MDSPALASRFTGALLGTFVGDALGMPFEGLLASMIARRWPADRPMMADRLGRGTYTDDTEMMIGVAESLVESGGLDVDDMADRLAANLDPQRGYGPGALRTLEAIRGGMPWEQAANLVFPDGSYGNGAAMRIAPVGALFNDSPDALRDAAEACARITHTHPLGIDGAVLQAAAVGTAVRWDPSKAFLPAAFLDTVHAVAGSLSQVYLTKLDDIDALLRSRPDEDQIVARLGNDVTAHGSVPTAVYSFLAHADSFEQAVVGAVSLGGDTDTIGAMTGSIAGAFHGVDSIPRAWFDALENGPKGRDYVIDLGRRLAELHRDR